MLRRHRRAGAVAAVSLLVLADPGCGAKSGLHRASVCVEGAVEPCVGPGGCNGSRRCLGRKLGFSSCDCGGECFDRVYGASTSSVSAHFVVDKSGSMEAVWPQATHALRSFFSSPASAGLTVALDFFPEGGGCNIGKYATPDVSFGRLERVGANFDAQEAALLDRLQEVRPEGETPLYAALSGALRVARARADVAAPGEIVVVVLVTDGSPTTCSDEQNSRIPELAAAEARARPSVRTFAIGLEGADELLVNDIAAAGDGEAFYIGSSNVAEELGASFEDIRALLRCEYSLSNPEDLDLDGVEVILRTGSGSRETLPRVAGPASCGMNAWFLDRATYPPSVELCPESCNELRRKDGLSVVVRAECRQP